MSPSRRESLSSHRMLQARKALITPVPLGLLNGNGVATHQSLADRIDEMSFGCWIVKRKVAVEGGQAQAGGLRFLHQIRREVRQIILRQPVAQRRRQ